MKKEDANLLIKKEQIMKIQRLIAALSPGEKNIFRRNCSTSGYSGEENAIYIQLFDCINDSWIETIRELKSGKLDNNEAPGANHQFIRNDIFFEKFQTRFRLRAFAKVEDLSKKSNYLYQKIMESIRVRQDEPNLRRDLNLMLADIHILFQKRLYEDCRDLLKKARKVALKLGILSTELELNRISRRLHAIIHGLEPIQTIRDIHVAEQKALEQIKLITAFFDLYQETHALSRSKLSIDKAPEIKTKINALIDYLNNDTLIKEAGFEIRFYYHATLANLAAKSDTSDFLTFIKEKGPQAVYYHYESIYKLYDEYPEQKNQDDSLYTSFVINYILQSFVINKPVDLKKFDEALSKISSSDPVEYLRQIVLLNIVQLIRNQEFSQAQRFLEEKNVWNLVQQNGYNIPASRRQNICYNAGLIYFVRENYIDALKWFELNHEDADPNGFIKILTINELFYFLTRYELNKTHIHKNKKVLIASLEKLLGKENLVQDTFEMFLYQSLLSILEIKQPKELSLYAKKTYQVGMDYLQKNADYSHFSLFLAWLESKAEEKSLRSVVHKYM
jgi:hypothetical protein